MDLGLSPRVEKLRQQVRSMVQNEIMPAEHEYEAEIGKAKDGNRFAFTHRQVEIREGLKSLAKQRGLWNFWLTDSDSGFGLTTLEYAHLAEEMGWSFLAPEIFNCSAPDTGNMEVLERFASQAHRDKWLPDLLNGKIRSAYLMTEPAVASSDATNIALSATRTKSGWLLNGEKWWASGAGDPRCEVYIVMARTGNTDKPRHERHSMFIMDSNTPGIEILRPMEVFGQDDAPHGHMHVRFNDVKIPADSVILGEGRGFEVAQGRLGPGRIHHCMRAIGQAERAFEMMCRRAVGREAFGRPLAKLGANPDIIANCRTEIDMARLLCLRTSHLMDTAGVPASQAAISQIKVVAPQVALKVVDEAIQMHGAMGISQDSPLAKMWTALRTLRFADGPDAVHRAQVAKAALREYNYS
ncbi:MAG: acyl-CoA dehydrogenase family protein [Alphaproteobacteria bacterium]